MSNAEQTTYFPEGWLEDFDCEDDPQFKTDFIPFIDVENGKLDKLDEERREYYADTQYVFTKHNQRVSRLTHDFAKHLGASDIAAQNLALAALLHDVGKPLVEDITKDNHESTPAYIWQEFPGKPADDLFTLRRTHSKLGADYMRRYFDHMEVSDHPFAILAANIAEYHHHSVNDIQDLPEDQKLAVSLVAIVEAFDGYCIKRRHFPENRDYSPLGALDHMRNKSDQFNQDFFQEFCQFIEARERAKKPEPHRGFSDGHQTATVALNEPS